MQALFSNWKTSVAGMVIIALGAANTFLGIHVPGFDLGFTAALTAGIGLIMAKDSNVTGGSVKQ